MQIRSSIVWLVLMSAEFAHGIARAAWLVPVVGDFRSRQIGVFIGSIINLVVTALFVRWMQPRRAAAAIVIGVTWLAMTLTFEIVFGRLWSAIIPFGPFFALSEAIRQDFPSVRIRSVT